MWNVLIGIITHSTFCFDWFGSLFSFLLLLNSVNSKKTPNLNCRPVSLQIWHLSHRRWAVKRQRKKCSPGGPSVWFRCELFQFCLRCCLCNSVFIQKAKKSKWFLKCLQKHLRGKAQLVTPARWVPARVSAELSVPESRTYQHLPPSLSALSTFTCFTVLSAAVTHWYVRFNIH